jgi:hypothetical protein
MRAMFVRIEIKEIAIKEKGRPVGRPRWYIAMLRR